MSDIRELTWSDVDTDATLKVDDSLTSGKSIVVGGFGPVRTGFGQHLTVPLTDEQMVRPIAIVHASAASAHRSAVRLGARSTLGAVVPLTSASVGEEGSRVSPDLVGRAWSSPSGP